MNSLELLSPSFSVGVAGVTGLVGGTGVPDAEYGEADSLPVRSR